MNEIFTRTSIRQFTNQKVEQVKVDMLLKAAMQAPTAGNQQPWLFYVVRDTEVIQKLSESSPYAGCTKNASTVIVIAYKEDTMFPELCEIDCAIATENIWLEAEAQGLGTVMLAVAPFEDRMAAVKEALNLPEEIKPFTILPIGYAEKKNEQQDRFDASKVAYIG